MRSSLGRPRSRDRSQRRRRRTPQSLRLAGDRCVQPDGSEGGTTMPDAAGARSGALSSTHAFDIEAAKKRLAETRRLRGRPRLAGSRDRRLRPRRTRAGSSAAARRRRGLRRPRGQRHARDRGQSGRSARGARGLRPRRRRASLRRLRAAERARDLREDGPVSSAAVRVVHRSASGARYGCPLCHASGGLWRQGG